MVKGAVLIGLGLLILNHSRGATSHKQLLSVMGIGLMILGALVIVF